MEKQHIKLFLQLITRTPMMIYPADADNMVSFIHGYEKGTEHACDFTELSQKLLSEKYKVSYSNDGWPGQIKRLAEKESKTWDRLFKEIAFEIIANECKGNLPEDLGEIITSRVRHLINQMERPLYEGWEERWLDLSSADACFPGQLWSAEELKIIHSITKEINLNNLYSDPEKKIPSVELQILMTQFKDATKGNAE